MFLPATDASILIAVTRATKIAEAERLKLLENASEEGKKVGRYVLGLDDDVDADTKRVGEKFKKWNAQSAKFGTVSPTKPSDAEASE